MFPPKPMTAKVDADYGKMLPMESLLEGIGRTPIVRLRKVTAGIKPRIYAKLENLNPGGNLKDRIALRMIEDAEERGVLRPGGTIIESTSGNTGISLALAAAIKGYRCVFAVPNKAGPEKLALLRAYGAEVVLCPAGAPADSPENFHRVAERLHGADPDSWLPNQYFNHVNATAHYESTGPEIWECTHGLITHFVCGMGTGGTISGVGRYLKERNPEVTVVGVDPLGSVLAGRFQGNAEAKARTWLIEGIGCAIMPGALDFRCVNRVISVTDREAFLSARGLARDEGILVGGSSGAACAAALALARDLTEDDLVVVLFPDAGDRYLTTIYNDDWMKERGFL